jgi:hypothetical protein
MLAQAVGVDPRNINYIAHSGGGEAAVAVMGGHVTAGVSGFGEWRAHVQSGRLRYLAVSSESRVTGDATPTIRESGFDVVLANWRSVAAPPGTSDEARQWLSMALRRMRDSAAWQEILRRNEWEDSFIDGPEFAEFLASEIDSNAATLSAMGLTPEPTLFPYIVAFGLLSSAAWVVLGRHKPARMTSVPADWKGFALLAGMVLVYVLVFERIGYVAATAALIFVTTRILGSPSWLRDLVTSVAVSGAAYFVFEILLQKGLP